MVNPFIRRPPKNAREWFELAGTVPAPSSAGTVTPISASSSQRDADRTPGTDFQSDPNRPARANPRSPTSPRDPPSLDSLNSTRDSATDLAGSGSTSRQPSSTAYRQLSSTPGREPPSTPVRPMLSRPSAGWAPLTLERPGLPVNEIPTPSQPFLNLLRAMFDDFATVEHQGHMLMGLEDVDDIYSFSRRDRGLQWFRRNYENLAEATRRQGLTGYVADLAVFIDIDATNVTRYGRLGLSLFHVPRNGINSREPCLGFSDFIRCFIFDLQHDPDITLDRLNRIMRHLIQAGRFRPDDELEDVIPRSAAPLQRTDWAVRLMEDFQASVDAGNRISGMAFGGYASGTGFKGGLGGGG